MDTHTSMIGLWRSRMGKVSSLSNKVLTLLEYLEYFIFLPHINIIIIIIIIILFAGLADRHLF